MMKFSDIPGRMRNFYSARYEPEGVRLLADIYWRALLASACVVVLLSLGWGVFDLLGVLNTLATTPDTSPAPPAAFSRTTLKNIVQGFQARETRFGSLGASRLPAVSDPSK